MSFALIGASHGSRKAVRAHQLRRAKQMTAKRLKTLKKVQRATCKKIKEKWL